MSQQPNEKMHILAKVFFILTILDLMELILTCVALFPNFKQMADYGQFMLIVIGVISAVIVVTLLIEIWSKIYLNRGFSSTNPRALDRQGYAAAAKFLLVMNLGAVLLGLLSAGGEGATLINQMRLYLQILFSVVEIITVFCYLRARKKLLKENKEEN